MAECFIRNPTRRKFFMSKNSKEFSQESEGLDSSSQRDVLIEMVSQNDVLVELIKAYVSIRSTETKLAFDLLARMVDLGEMMVKSEIKHKKDVRKKWKFEQSQAKKSCKKSCEETVQRAASRAFTGSSRFKVDTTSPVSEGLSDAASESNSKIVDSVSKQSTKEKKVSPFITSRTKKV